MRIPRRYANVRALLAALFAFLFGLIIVVNVVEPLTPIEQQALIGAIIVLGCLALWLF